MQAIVADSIEAFGREEWNALFPGELEDWSYYHAVEKSGVSGFAWLYFGVRENGALRAAVPAFVTDYRLDTTVRGALRHVTDALARAFPRLLRQRLLSLGSPVSEICHLGFAADCDNAARTRLLGLILRKVEQYARGQRIPMLAAKDASAAQDALWAPAGAAEGLRRQPGLPTALLDVRFASIDAYVASLSAGTRKDMRRKLKSAAALRVEWRTNIDDIRDDIMRLYRETHARAELDFEELTPEYFGGVLRELGARASCVTYWLGDKLVAFNLVLHDEQRLLDKFLGMDYAVAHEYNLYFVTWFENVRWCIEHGVPLYQSGQGLHREKLRLGSRLAANWLWYRHRNPLLDRIFAAVEKLARLDRDDAALAALSRRENTPRRTQWFAWFTLVALELVCQIALKSAGIEVGEFELTWHTFASALRNTWLWLAIITYVGQFAAWMTILRHSTLSGAFPTSAITIIGVMVASTVLFAEPIGWLRALGAAIIIGGILLLGADEPSPAAAAIDRDETVG